MDIHSYCSFCKAPVTRRAQSVTANVQRHFCNMECKSGFQKLAKPVTREWLEAKYETEGLDCVQIGRLVCRDPKSVWNWLKDFGIKTRPRGGNWAQIPKGGFKGKKHTPEFRAKLSQYAKETGRVPYKPSVGSYMKGRKGKDTPSWKGGLTPERQSFYASEEWKEACKAVWHRANARCERCGKHHNIAEVRGTFHVHHIVSFMVRALRAEPSNLALLCKECHRFVHSRKNEAKEFLKGK